MKTFLAFLTFFFVFCISALAVPTRLPGRIDYSGIAILAENTSSYPCTTTVRNTGAPGKINLEIEYLDENQQRLSSEFIQFDCQFGSEEWFRWHPPAGMKFYRYLFYPRGYQWIPLPLR
jgi:hypothetical protein